MYYNTTKEPKENVKVYEGINKNQDTKVLIICKELKTFGASDVYKKYLHKHVKDGIVITSVRRSINTLKKNGYVEKTGNRVMGMFGRSELEYKTV